MDATAHQQPCGVGKVLEVDELEVIWDDNICKLLPPSQNDCPCS